MKKAFTMIELIFVIVILGILAAVALPKFVGVAQEAREGNLKSFVGTLNRTVGPTLWSQALKNDSGNIGAYALAENIDLSNYVDIPKEIENHKISDCNDKTKFKVIAKINKDIMGGDKYYYVLCKSGTNVEAPKFELVKSTNNLSLGDANTTDLYGSTPKIENKEVILVTK